MNEIERFEQRIKALEDKKSYHLEQARKLKQQIKYEKNVLDLKVKEIYNKMKKEARMIKNANKTKTD